MRPVAQRNTHCQWKKSEETSEEWEQELPFRSLSNPFEEACLDYNFYALTKLTKYRTHTHKAKVTFPIQELVPQIQILNDPLQIALCLKLPAMPCQYLVSKWARQTWNGFDMFWSCLCHSQGCESNKGLRPFNLSCEADAVARFLFASRISSLDWNQFHAIAWFLCSRPLE